MYHQATVTALSDPYIAIFKNDEKQLSVADGRAQSVKTKKTTTTTNNQNKP